MARAPAPSSWASRLRRASPSRSASACSSTGRCRTARTAGSPATSRRPGCAATRSSRTSTCAAPRGLDRATVLAPRRGPLGRAPTATCSSPGRPASGKTFLACALAHAAIRAGSHRALPAGAAAARRARARPGRWPSATADGVLGPDRRPGPRRPGARSRCRGPGRRPAGGHRGPRRRCARPSSPASCRSATGTRPSAIPPSPTPSSTAWSTAPIASSSGATRAGRCGRAGPGPRRRSRTCQTPHPRPRGGELQGVSKAPTSAVRGLRRE